MGIIEFQGAIPRTQDASVIRHNESNKGQVDQLNYGQNVRKANENKAMSVNGNENSSKSENRKNAGDKGSNEYLGDGGKRRPRKKSSDKKDDKTKSTFDIRI